jgi:hypothetical protein
MQGVGFSSGGVMSDPSEHIHEPSPLMDIIHFGDRDQDECHRRPSPVVV